MSNFHTYGQEKMKSQFALGHQENYSFRISFKNVDEGMKNHMNMRIIQAKIIGIDILTISSYWSLCYKRKSKPTYFMLFWLILAAGL